MIKDWLQKIEKKAAKAHAEGDEFGACMLPDPNGGPAMCVPLDKDTCQNLGGTYLGGDCQE